MPPNLSYFVCGTPRSGSSLLCEALKASDISGKPEEYFWRDDEPFWRQRWDVADYAGYIQCALDEGSTPNGVFGAKLMMGGYFSHFVAQLQTLPQFQTGEGRAPVMLEAVFPNLRYIWITRRNKVRQAVSFWKAVQTGIWVWPNGEAPMPQTEAVYDFNAIDRLLQEIVLREASWQAYFDDAQVIPKVIVYEDFIAHYVDTTLGILRWLNIDVPHDFRVQAPRIQKQTDEISESWVMRYRRERQMGWKNLAWEYPA
jgi:trehalose 2-sulfotransferase